MVWEEGEVREWEPLYFCRHAHACQKRAPETSAQRLNASESRLSSTKVRIPGVPCTAQAREGRRKKLEDYNRLRLRLVLRLVFWGQVLSVRSVTGPRMGTWSMSAGEALVNFGGTYRQEGRNHCSRCHLGKD